ncbi:hypothetical protein ABZV77_34650 [Streptomyces sp. NPDC004732]|uniref:effector-associated constant component EACC1 n=1 Tax=Streptomyces sp. NPDC004732 TaxID=3154290 RepID=UPI0033BBEB2B
MEMSLSVDSPAAGDEAALLRRWLLSDRGLRGHVTMQATQPGAGDESSGAMGPSALELINVAASNAIALGNLLLSVALWRSSRPSPPPTVRIEANGVSVTVNTDDQETLRELTEMLQRARPER